MSVQKFFGQKQILGPKKSLSKKRLKPNLTKKKGKLESCYGQMSHGQMLP